MYARGMTTRDIQGHLEEMYGVEVSPILISNVIGAVLDEVRAWQNCPLDAVYTIVYLDALVVKMPEQGQVENRAVYVAIGIDMQGHKEVLGLWISANEGAKFWLSVLTELKNRDETNPTKEVGSEISRGGGPTMSIPGSLISLRNVNPRSASPLATIAITAAPPEPV